MGRDSLASGNGTSLDDCHLMMTLKKPQRACQYLSGVAAGCPWESIAEKSASIS
jgi:hypothetical protein